MQGLTWSTDRVLHNTLAHAESLGLNVAPVDLLPRLQDIDTAQVPHSSFPVFVAGNVNSTRGRC